MRPASVIATVVVFSCLPPAFAQSTARAPSSKDSGRCKGWTDVAMLLEMGCYEEVAERTSKETCAENEARRLALTRLGRRCGDSTLTVYVYHNQNTEWAFEGVTVRTKGAGNTVEPLMDLHRSDFQRMGREGLFYFQIKRTFRPFFDAPLLVTPRYDDEEGKSEEISAKGNQGKSVLFLVDPRYARQYQPAGIGIASLVGSAVFAVVGGILLAFSVSVEENIKRRCDPQLLHCRPEAKPDYESFLGLRWAGTIGFGVSLATCTFPWFLSLRKKFHGDSCFHWIGR